MRLAVLALVVTAVPGCLRPVPRARTERFEAPSPAELEAADRVRRRSCSGSWGLLFPGLGHACSHRPGEAAALGGLAAAEAGTAIVVGREHGIEHPGAAVPLIGLQDLWLIGSLDPMRDDQLAAGLRFTPPDRLGDLAVAPFNLEVLRRPEVWAGLAVMLAAGIGVTIAADGKPDSSRAGDDPNLFGSTVDRRWGYPAAGGIGVGLFGQVAVAEELTFRGWAQSGMARSQGETRGWLSASLLFGAVHAFNIFAMPAEDRRDYLLYGVPFITGLGTYLGWVYRHDGYSLAPSVAIHFWYDFLLSATFFAIDPQSSPLSAGVTVPF